MNLINKYKQLRYFVFGVLMLSITTQGNAQNNVPDNVERAALQALYNHTNGANWSVEKRWTLGRINSYPDSVLYGVQIENGDITALSLEYSGLNGTLPAELNNLTELQYIAMTGNNLTGTLPDLSGLQKIIMINLENTDFSGAFPTWVCNLSKMQALYFSSNPNTPLIQMSGPIPSEISQLSKLRTFAFSYNDLSMANAVPNSLSSLDDLSTIQLVKCGLTPASVSTGFSGLNMLVQIDLSENPSFKTTEGVFPDVLFDLPHLNNLFLKNMDLYKLPASITEIPNLVYLSLSGNNYSDSSKLGDVVDTLRYCPLLRTLDLTNCKIGGTPPNFYTLSSVHNLYLNDNDLKVSHWESVGRMPELKALSVYNCNLTDFPESIVQLETLVWLYAPQNKLYPIPEKIKNIPALEYLYLGNNNIEVLPEWFGSANMNSITVLSLELNKIVFPLPDNFRRFINLNELLLNSNKLKGRLDEYFSTFEKIRYFNVSYNELENPLPDVSLWNNLNNVNLRYNKFSGTLPSYYSNATKSVVDIGFNFFDEFTSFVGSPSLTLSIEKNKFTFADVLKQTATIGNYQYAYQDSVDVKQTIEANAGDVLILHASIDTLTSLHCKFQWFKYLNGVSTPVTGTPLETEKRHTINFVDAADNGATYYYTITNDTRPNLTLVSRPIKVNVFGENPDPGTGTSCESTLEEEYSALMALYQATNIGEGWANKGGWMSANPNVVQNLTGWYGLEVDLDGHVTSVNLANNNLNGLLPSSIGKLCKVKIINLSGNHLKDSIPSSIGNLRDLRTLNLYANELTGSIPAALAKLSELEFLSIEHNKMSGRIPAEFGRLSKLQTLSLTSNMLSDIIPTELGALSNLQLLLLANNQLTGSIPSSLGSLVNLRMLALSNNRLTDSIPSSIGNLSKLEEFNAQLNMLTGVLPKALGKLTVLKNMSLGVNQLSGTIPHELGNLSNLISLNLTNNLLDGLIPSSLGNLQNLVSLEMGFNKLTGTLPLSLSMLTKLRGLHLQNNQLTGTLDAAFGNLQNLESIYISENQFEGNITSTMSGWTKMKFFRIQNNKFSGVIPNFESLVDAQIGRNNFTFSSFLSLKSVFSGGTFTYAPQDSIDVKKTIYTPLGRTLTLTTSIDRTTSTPSLYQWFKIVNGVSTPLMPSPSASGHTYTINSVAETDLNVQYYYKITNPEAPNLTLTSRLQKVVLGTGCEADYEEEYRALMDLYQATNGAEWKRNNGWRDANPNVVQSLQGWDGVGLNADGHVVTLYLTDNNLNGSIPPSIGKLKSLNRILVDYNKLNGSIPSEIGDLVCMGELWLNSNQLTGSIPVSFANLKNLYALVLEKNQLEGSIPAGIFDLPKMSHFNLGMNKLSGSLPENFTGMRDAVYFDVSINQITGTIPSTLGSLTKLNSLRLYANQLTGSIPSSLGNLAVLKDLGLSGNQLSGSIPAELGNLRELTNILLNNNQLSGSVPESFSQLTKLFILALNDNTLSGSVEFLSDLTSLTQFMVYNNSFTGAIPSLSQVSNLQYLWIHNNQFSGAIPNDIMNCAALFSINITNNDITSIPDLSQHPNKINLDIAIAQNRLTFTHVLPIVLGLPYRGLAYAPQKLIDVEKELTTFAGKPFTLSTEIDVAVEPNCLYQWFKVLNGVETPLNTPTHDARNFTVAGFALSDNNAQLYYKITNPSAPGLILTSRLQHLNVIEQCKAADVSDLSFSTTEYWCAIQFTSAVAYGEECLTQSYAWDFGDGSTSIDRNPIHSYGSGGNYNVSLRVRYSCGLCVGDTTISKQVVYNPATGSMVNQLVNVTTDIKPKVINTSASTFSDAWPLTHENALARDQNSFLNGSQGVWRNDASYVYDVPRDTITTEPVKIYENGTYNLQHFSWEKAEHQLIPHWTKANTMTLYSPFSYELENRDVLGVYSSALYDYGGHLPSANGVNMRHAEMAFTSFEYMAIGKKISAFEGKTSGNWVFGGDEIPATSTYTVSIASSYTALVEASPETFDNVAVVDVTAKHGTLSQYIANDKLICVQPYSVNPNWSIVVLNESPFDAIWGGSITVKNIVRPVITSEIDSTFAHSGRSSLKINADKTFEQNFIKLDSGKSYFINMWVSVNDANVTTPWLANDLGVDVIIKNKDDQLVSTLSFQPAGRIIEGWQQVKGVFKCPVTKSKIELKFKAGSKGSAWYDDLRLHPEKGNMRSYVYNLNDYRLRAILDEENFASFFYYDAEGNLYLTKKETEEGVKTITENVSYQKKTKR